MGLTTQIVHGARATRLMLLLHGVGADERDLAGLAPLLDPTGRFVTVIPRGQYSQPPGYAWYSFNSPQVMQSNVKTSVESLDETVDDALATNALTLEGSVIAGFSQGGSMALALGFGSDRAERRPAAVLVMSGFLLPDVVIDYDFSGELPVVFIQHGATDDVVITDRARASALYLKEHGVPVNYTEYEMGHQITNESIADAASFLEKIAAGERPETEVPDMSDEYKQHVQEAIEQAQAMATAEDDGQAADEDNQNLLVRPVNVRNFQTEVLDSEVPVIVDFWAPWCQPCLQVSPIVEAIALMRKASYKVVKVNIDENPALAQQYGVQSIPLVALFRNGRLERQSLGVKSRPQLEAELGMLVIP